jgi:hypothetical protein
VAPPGAWKAVQRTAVGDVEGRGSGSSSGGGGSSSGSSSAASSVLCDLAARAALAEVLCWLASELLEDAGQHAAFAEGEGARVQQGGASVGRTQRRRAHPAMAHWGFSTAISNGGACGELKADHCTSRRMCGVASVVQCLSIHGPTLPCLPWRPLQRCCSAAAPALPARGAAAAGGTWRGGCCAKWTSHSWSKR